ncbi:MAG: type II toxin-antitoxin system Phd/YefM family antitoxin [Bacteroidota bacterium]
MEYVQYTEFRNNSKYYIERLDGTDGLIIVRRGKPVAKVLPFDANPAKSIPIWKRNIKALTIKNAPDSTSLLREMRDEG